MKQIQEIFDTDFRYTGVWVEQDTLDSTTFWVKYSEKVKKVFMEKTETPKIPR